VPVNVLDADPQESEHPDVRPANGAGEIAMASDDGTAPSESTEAQHETGEDGDATQHGAGADRDGNAEQSGTTDSGTTATIDATPDDLERLGRDPHTGYKTSEPNQATVLAADGQSDNVTQDDGGANRAADTGATQDGEEDRKRDLVEDQEALLDVANEAAGGSLDNLTNYKPSFWQGERPDGTTVKIEWEPKGHANTNEGPHVTVRELKDPDAGPKGGWRVTSKTFIAGRETWKGV